MILSPQATPSLGNVNYAKTGEPAHKAHGVGICLVMDSLYMSLINWNGLQRPITRLDHGDKVAGHAVMQVSETLWSAALLMLHQYEPCISHAACEKLLLQLLHMQITRCSNTGVSSSSQSLNAIHHCKAPRLLTVVQHP